MEARKFQIVGVGSPIVDSLAHISEHFIEGIEGAKGGMELVNAETLRDLIDQIDSEIIQAPGGSAGNTVFAMSRLGSKTTFLGKLGNDKSADFYKTSFSALGGDVSGFKVADIPNGHCLSLVTPDSERTMRTDLGAAMTLTPNEVSADDFRQTRHAHIEGYLLFNPDLMDAVLQAAKEAGCTLSLDLASFEVVNAAKGCLPQLLENYIDIVFANEEEATAYCGEGRSYETMAKELSTLCETAVVKLGKDGSIIAQGGEIFRVDPITVSRVQDTTAAGDYWAAGFLYGYLNGMSLNEAGLCGSLLGAEVVQVLGSVLSDESWATLKTKIQAFV